MLSKDKKTISYITQNIVISVEIIFILQKILKYCSIDCNLVVKVTLQQNSKIEKIVSTFVSL